MKVEIWTIFDQDQHRVYENVNEYHLTDKEKFVCIIRCNGNQIEYVPTVDIQRIVIKRQKKKDRVRTTKLPHSSR